MKSDWSYYPLSLFAAAARSTVGAVVALIVGLSVGTWFGFLVLADDLDCFTDPSCWGFAFVVFLGPLAVSCIQFWGFLQVGLIIVALHTLLHDEASRYRTAMFIAFPQFVCTVIAYSTLDMFDWDIVLRFLIVAPFVALLAATPLMVDRHRRRKQPTPNSSVRGIQR